MASSLVNPGHYIVVLITVASITTFTTRHKITPLITFDGKDGAIYGFGVKLTEAQRQAVAADAEVASLEQDLLGYIDPPAHNRGGREAGGSVTGSLDPGFYYLKSTSNQQYLSTRMKRGQPVIAQRPNEPTDPWELESAGNDTFTLHTRHNYLRVFGSPRNASVECEIQAPDESPQEKKAVFRIESQVDPASGAFRYLFHLVGYDPWLLAVAPPFAMPAPVGGNPSTQVVWTVTKWVPPSTPW
ncbi:hypothetical protein FB451DRAFT_1277928 [Mycena latifolia]|nr:hypothetical protein FB451DRAFT_1277928 [Mycena latifolia]